MGLFPWGTPDAGYPRILTEGGGVSTLDRSGTVERVDDDSTDDEYDDWYCIKVRAGRCAGCGQPYSHVIDTAYHRIVVWPEKDDPSLLKVAAEAGRANVNPRVVSYEQALGRCVSWYRLASGKGDPVW